ncbi:DUF4132 domain-containing protein [Streptomyces sp. NPDC003042]
MQRWEYVGEGSAMFWEAEAEGLSVTLRFGRSGSAGSTRVKEFDSPADAQSYLVRAIAEKERKEYGKTGAPGSADAPAAPRPTVEDVAAGGEASPALPDEETFTLPATWKRNLHPRRGGVPSTGSPLDENAPVTLRQWLADCSGSVETMLSSATSEPRLVEAARAHQGGRADPLGAAVLATPLATLLPSRRSTLAAVADAWAVEHGLPFAAVAAVELLEIQNTWEGRGNKNLLTGIESRPEDQHEWSRPAGRIALGRIRSLLAMADEETYRAAVAALARRRHSVRRSVSVSFLVPTQEQWVDECLANPAARLHADTSVRELLLCSIGTPGQARAYGGRADIGWRSWDATVVATVAEGVGAAMAPLLAGELNRQDVDTDYTKAMAAALAELPGDDAFGFLLARLDSRHVRPALMAAARRFPVRALRLLAAASCGSDNGASPARQLLASHVAAHHALALAVLPDLAQPLAAIVAPLAHGEGRIPEVSADRLPALLTSPPWTRKRTVVKPRVIGGPAAPAGARMAWRADERQAWAAGESWATGWKPYRPLEHYLDALRKGIRVNPYDAVGLFTHGPAELVRPLLADWEGPGHAYEGLSIFKPIVAAHELAALPVAMRMAALNPTVMAPILLPFVDVGVARAMADWLERLKTAGQTARAWFARHGAEAAGLLVPDALAAPGAARTAAERALTLIAATHGADAVRQAAAGYGAQAAEAIEVLLASDPLESALPARMPKPAEWAGGAGGVGGAGGSDGSVLRALPQVELVAGGALPVASVGHVVTMLALSKPGGVYPGLAQVRELCTKESLAEFVWALFGAWQLAGMPPKESWALHALGWFGDDGTVRGLTPVIRAWPGEGAHQRAVEGLDVLAAIGTDTALLHLHGIAQRVKFKALKLRAQEKITEVAAELGLGADELADRLVPDLGLDADGGTVVDYGTRRFTVGFDERLAPYVRDASGRRLKDLPKPGAQDDAEAAAAERKRFMALKKEVRAIAADQVRRLEAAMVNGRSWTAADFRQLFVEHPLLGHLVRRLVWLAESSGGGTGAFRVTGHAYADVKGETVVVPDDVTVRLAHPLHLGSEAAALWSGAFAEYGIAQPFPQLDRPVLAVTEEEAAGARLTRFEGITVPVGKLLGMQKRGWERGVPQDAGVERWFSRRLGPECHLVIALDEGIAVGMTSEFPDQRLDTVWLDKQPGDHWQSRTYPMRFGDLDPVTVSEVLADLTELTS